MRRIIVAGIAEPDRPGSIQVLRYEVGETVDRKLQYAMEIQAHSK